jgi:GntR family transcriptional regulator, transcriptional repressor for pyruvate dehydrogenase complex
VLSASPVPGAPRHVRAAHSFTEVADLLEARLVLEPAVLASAAVDPDPAALDRAHDAVAGMALAIGTQAAPADTDHRVHALIAQVCRNPVLREDLTTLLARASGPVWRQSQDTAWQKDAGLSRQWVHDHGEIVQALERGDAEAAAVLSRRHLLSAVGNAAECEQMPVSVRRRLHRLGDRFRIHPDNS